MPDKDGGKRRDAAPASRPLARLLTADPANGAGQVGRIMSRKWDPESAKAARRGFAAPASLFPYPRLWLAGIVVAALVIRARFVGHPLGWDEANLLIALRDFVETGAVGLYWKVHGPVYMLLALPFSYFSRYPHVAVQVMSTLFSLGCVVMLYQLTRLLMDEDTAVVAAAALTAMPLGAIYSTWVKPESLMVLLSLTALWLFLKGRWALAAVPMAVAVLTKEYSLLVPGATLVWAACTFQWGTVRRWLGWMAVTGALTSWFFVAFWGAGGHFLDNFFGASMEGIWWTKPWYYYLKILPADLGWGVLAFAVVGAVWGLWRSAGDDFGYTLPLVWLAVVYALFSVSSVKVHWYLYQATPVWAMVAGAGVVGLLKLAPSDGRRWVAIGLVAVLLALGIRGSYRSYTEGHSYFASYDWSAAQGRALGSRIAPGERVGFSTLPDSLLIYHAGIRPSDAFLIPTTVRADLMRAGGKEVPYEDEELIFKRWVSQAQVRWIVLQGYEHYPAELRVVEAWKGRRWVDPVTAAYEVPATFAPTQKGG